MIRPWIRGGPGVDDKKLFAAGIDESENTKGGSITVPLTSYLTGLDWFVLQIKTNIVSCHTADSKPVKQEVSGTVILPPLVFPGRMFVLSWSVRPVQAFLA
jgi:hypothetical protein